MAAKLLLIVLSHGKFRRDTCLKLPQTLDKRVQIDKTKLYPHLLMHKLFKNPRLISKEQLYSVKHCKYPFESKVSGFICINPYHYCESEERSSSSLCNTGAGVTYRDGLETQRFYDTLQQQDIPNQVIAQQNYLADQLKSQFGKYFIYYLLLLALYRFVVSIDYVYII
ncbi:MAG: Domain B in dwarfin protein [Marteilia pararefringens]